MNAPGDPEAATSAAEVGMREPIRARYVEARAALSHMTQAALRFQDQSTFDEAVRSLGIRREGRKIYADQSVQAILMDFACFGVRRGNSTAVERYLKMHPPADGSLAETISAAAVKSVYRLLAFERRCDDGRVQVRDALSGLSKPLADVAMCSNSDATFEAVLIATRTVDFEDGWMLTGASLPAPASALDVLLKMLRGENLLTAAGVLRPGADVNARAAQFIVRMLLRSGASRFVRQQNIGTGGTAEAAEPAE